MGVGKPVWVSLFCASVAMAGAAPAGARFDGNWNTKLSCEAHGETPAYSWEFPSVIKDGKLSCAAWGARWTGIPGD
jgi:hypothetical protein